MPRMRVIKPEFFVSETIGDLSPAARLALIGLWTLGDKSGRLKDSPKQIKLQLFGYDTTRVEPLLAELAKAGLIIRYHAANTDIIQIANWDQFTHHREKASIYPPPPPDAVAKAAPPPVDEPLPLLGPDNLFGIEEPPVANGKRFVQPKPEEVTAYAASIDFAVDGTHFCDFYQSKGWKVGQTPMKDWKAVVRQWKSRRSTSDGQSAPDGGY